MSSSGKELENLRLRKRVRLLEQQVGDLTGLIDRANAKLKEMTERRDLWQKKCVSLCNERDALIKEIKAFNKEDNR